MSDFLAEQITSLQVELAEANSAKRELLAACTMAAEIIRRTVHADAVPKALVDAIAKHGEVAK